MNSLQARLEDLPGVTHIELELGDEGLAGITVNLSAEADEEIVLESVRRLLVAYGTEAATSAEPIRTGRVVDLAAIEQPADHPPLAGPSAQRTIRGHLVRLVVEEGLDGAVLELDVGGVRRRKLVAASPKFITQGVLDLGCEAVGARAVAVIGINLSNISRAKVFTVITVEPGEAPQVSTTSVTGGDWPTTLLDVLDQVTQSQDRIGIVNG